MKTYPKIQTVWNRDPENRNKTLIEGDWAKPEFFYLKDCPWECTEKFDGTNIRVIWDREILTFGRKTDNASIPAFLFSKLQERFCNERMSEVFDGPVCLYGEGFGARIQGGGGNYIRDGVDFILFDVRIDNLWLRRDDVEDIAKKLDIMVVPIVLVDSLEKAINFVREPVRSSIGTGMIEGLVIRPIVELLNRRGERVITKIKAKDFQKR